jgi:uncharacterized protein
MHSPARDSRWMSHAALAALLLAPMRLPAQSVARETNAVPAPALARLVPPAPTPASFVADERDVVPADAQARIDSSIRALQDAGYGDVAVAILPSIGDYQPAEVGVAIYRGWRVGRVDAIGSARRDLGVLLLVVPKELAPDGEGHCWITTGLGAEGIITDSRAGDICRDAVVPLLRARDYAGAVTAGVDAIAERLRDDDGLAAAADPAGFAERQQRRAERRRRAGIVAISLFGGLGVLGAGAVGVSRWRRRRPRTCPHCGRPMQRLSEQADDQALRAGQQVEERLGSVDYDVWRCGCGGETVLPYARSFSDYQGCERCHARAAKTDTRVIRAATYHGSGLAEETQRCEACQSTTTKTVVLPILPPPSSSSSGGGGGGGGGGHSFGGSGGTSGGGGGSSY